MYIMGSNPQKNLNLIFIQVCYRLYCKRFLAVSLCAPPTCTFSCIKLLDLSSSWLCTGFMFTKKIILIQKCNKKRAKVCLFALAYKKPTTKTYLLICSDRSQSMQDSGSIHQLHHKTQTVFFKLDVRVQNILMLIPEKNLSPKTQKISTPNSPQIS